MSKELRPSDPEFDAPRAKLTYGNRRAITLGLAGATALLLASPLVWASDPPTPQPWTPGPLSVAPIPYLARPLTPDPFDPIPIARQSSRQIDPIPIARQASTIYDPIPIVSVPPLKKKSRQ